MFEKVNLRPRANSYPRNCLFGDDNARRAFNDACDEMVAKMVTRYVVGPASSIRTKRGLLGRGAPISLDDIDDERSVEGRVIKSALGVFNAMLDHREVLEREDFTPTPEAA